MKGVFSTVSDKFVRSGAGKMSPADPANRTDLIPVIVGSIPSYLHGSEFYLNLDRADPEGVIYVPEGCYKEDERVLNLEQLEQLLQTIRFWGFDELPQSIFQFCRYQEVDMWHPTAEKFLDTGTSETLWAYFTGYCGLRHVIKYNRRDMFRHWLSVNPPGSDNYASTHATVDAIMLGGLDSLTYLHRKGYPLTGDLCKIAARKGDLDSLKYLHIKGCEWGVGVCAVAAEYGKNECLIYAHENGCTWDEKVCAVAAENGHLNCLQYAYDNHCPYDNGVTFNATWKGKYACLEFAVLHGFPIHPDCCLEAVRLSSLQFLVLLHENGAHWDHTVAEAATKSDSTEILQYVLENGCPTGDDLLLHALSSAASSVACLRYLIEVQGLYMNKDGSIFTQALLHCNYACVEYLVDVGCPKVFSEETHLADKWKYYTDKLPFAQSADYASSHGWQPEDLFHMYVRKKCDAVRVYKELREGRLPHHDVYCRHCECMTTCECCDVGDCKDAYNCLYCNYVLSSNSASAVEDIALLDEGGHDTKELTTVLESPSV